jgi:DNA polymerase V
MPIHTQIKIIEVDDLSEFLLAGAFARGLANASSLITNNQYTGNPLDIAYKLIKNPEATFFVTVEGDSMEPVIRSGDVLIVDRSIEPDDNRVIIACIAGDLYVKRLKFIDQSKYLFSDNKKYGPIKIVDEMEFEIFGTVLYTLHSLI